MAYRSSKRKYGGRRSYGNTVRGLLSAGMRVAMRARGSRSYTRTKKRGTTGVGVTNQFDTKWIYRRKRMPRGKRRAWKRAIRKHTAINLKQLGTTSVIRNNTLSQTWTGDAQRIARTHLYGLNGVNIGTEENGTDDLYSIQNADSAINEQTERMIFASGVLDCTFHNTGNSKLEVDVYTVYNYGFNHGNSYGTDLVSADVVTLPTGIGASDFNGATRGVTPFQFPYLSKMGKKIINKKKYFLAAGEVFTWQMRDPRNHHLKNQDIVRNDTYVKPGLTKTVLFIVKNVAGTGSDVTNAFSVGCTRTYSYKVLQNNKDYNNLIV